MCVFLYVGVCVCVNNIDTIDNFNLKSQKCPPICKDMLNFENDVTDMVRNIKFRKHLDNF